MTRLVRLSSMIATAVPRRGRRLCSTAAALSDSRKSAVNQNRLPTPFVLSTPISPPISWVSIRAIASPSPVPPWRRVVELSTCE